MPVRGTAVRPALTVRVSADAWRGHQTSAVTLRFAARIPFSMPAQEAVPAFGVSVRDFVGELGRAVDDSTPPLAGRLYASSSKGSSLPSVVVMEVMVPREVERAMQDRRGPEGWVTLPQPWGGAAAVFTGSSSEVRSAHLLGLPPSLSLEYLQEILAGSGIIASELDRVVDPITGFGRGDAARLVVPATTKLPETILITDEASAAQLATISVRPISSLPPIHGGAGRSSYAAAAAAPAGVVAVPRQPPSPPSGSRSAAAAADQPGQQRRQQGSRQPAAGGSSRPPSPSARGNGRERSRSPRSPRAAPSPPGGSVGAAGLRQPPPAQHDSPTPAEVDGTPKKRIVSAAGGAPAAVPSSNRFQQLTDAADMDTGPAVLAAQLTAEAALAADIDMADGNGSGTGGGSA